MNQIALVTGANKGIGFHTVRLLDPDRGRAAEARLRSEGSTRAPAPST